MRFQVCLLAQPKMSMCKHYRVQGETSEPASIRRKDPTDYLFPQKSTSSHYYILKGHYYWVFHSVTGV